MNLAACFIKATEEYNTFENYVPAPYIRKSFISDVAAAGKLSIAVCGFYELYLNGDRITKGALAPYISNPDHYVYYDEYKVKIETGENVIGIHLGNGFQNNPGGYIWDFDKASFRSAPLMALSLTYPGKDGEKITVKSDASFKTAPSPILTDDYRFGEVYDATREISGWNGKGFDESEWRKVIPVTAPRGELRLCSAEPILTETVRAPIAVRREEDSFIYDFGLSAAGVCRLQIRGARGQRVEMQHADALRDGRFYIDNVWFVRKHWERDKEIVHKDVYICKGGGTEIYTPSFTYHGFRYVKVDGITEEQAVPELLTCVVMHSALASRGGFSCSDETANKLQDMTRRSDLDNFYYFPIDCPQREKNGWTADAALSAEQLLLNFAAEGSYREWMRNIRKAQNSEGALPGIVPTGGWGFKWGNGPAWDSVLVYLPYFVYIYRGDSAMVKESAGAFMAYLRYLTTRKDADGLIHIGLGDWCHVGRGDKPKAPLELTDTVISMDIAYKMAFLFDEVGMTARRNFARVVAEDFRAAIRKHLIDFGTMMAAGHCQTSQAMCIYYNVFTPAESQTAFERLLELVHAADDHIDVGVLGARVLFHVLSQYGHNELAFKMVTRPDYPSYGNWIERGATTLWEDFWPDKVGSMNHHFWGDISAWFIKCLAGIRFNPDGNDINKVEFRPCFVTALEHATAYYKAPAGMIRSSWQRKGGRIHLCLQFPEGARATLRLENGFALENGLTYTAVSSGEYIIVPRAF